MTLLNLLFGLSIIFPLPADLDIETGYLSQFAQGPTDGTLAYRQSVGELPEDLSMYDGFLAVPDCDRIGHVAWLSIQGGPWGLYMTMDCSGHASTTEWMDRDRILAEVDFYTARDHGFLGEGGIEAAIAWP